MDWYIEVIKQAPSLGVLVYLVFYFLRHLRSVNDENHARYKEGIATFTWTCGKSQERVVRAVEKNAEVISELNRLLYKLNGGAK